RWLATRYHVSICAGNRGQVWHTRCLPGRRRATAYKGDRHGEVSSLWNGGQSEGRPRENPVRGPDQLLLLSGVQRGVREEPAALHSSSHSLKGHGARAFHGAESRAPCLVSKARYSVRKTSVER